MEQLKHLAFSRGCYKVILDCTEQNVPFYLSCGFTRKEVQMALYRPNTTAGSASNSTDSSSRNSSTTGAIASKL